MPAKSKEPTDNKKENPNAAQSGKQGEGQDEGEDQAEDGKRTQQRRREPLGTENIGQKTMEDIDGGLHILQWMDKA